MNNVIAFPVKSARTRIDMERDVRAGMNDAGVSPTAIELIITNMSGFFDVLSGEYILTVDLADGGVPFSKAETFSCALPSRFTESLVQERVRAEVQRLVADGVL
jgi:hypothetical protein